MGRNGNAPRVLASTTKRGVPLASLFLTFVVGLIVFLPFPSWQQLVGFVTSATVLSFGAGTLAIVALRQQLPDHDRPFRLRGGHVIPFLAFYASNLIVYWAGWDVNWKLFVAILLGFVLLGVFHVTGRGDTPPMDWRSGATWTLPWLGGLCLISYLGDYPDQSKKAGNVAAIGFGWGFLVILALSVIVYVLAYSVRMPGGRTEEYLEQTKSESREEERELGSAGAH
jgi:amino acid transporter